MQRLAYRNDMIVISSSYRYVRNLKSLSNINYFVDTISNEDWHACKQQGLNMNEMFAKFFHKFKFIVKRCFTEDRCMVKTIAYYRLKND